MLERFGTRYWLAALMFALGIASAAMMFVQDETSFYVVRLLIGAAKAGLAPGIFFYLSLGTGRIIGQHDRRLSVGDAGRERDRVSDIGYYHAASWRRRLIGLAMDVPPRSNSGSCIGSHQSSHGE
jgi:MFS family permease